MVAEFRPEEILRVLSENQVNYVLIGGLAAARTWNVSTRFGDLGISFRPSGTQGFPDLTRDAAPIVIRGITVRLASLADVVRSKEAAGRDKDRRALPVLREILARRLHEQDRP